MELRAAASVVPIHFVNTVKRNLAANLVGGVWNSALSLLFIPTYLRLLGVEAYGLIGFYATLHAIFGLFDLGLGATFNRTIARLSANPLSQKRQGDVVRTFELIYHSIGVGAGALLFVSAPFIARHWVHVQQLPLHQVTDAIRLMGVVTALQFPFALYQGGLLGLQRHVVLNVIAMVSSTLRAGGAVLVLMFVSQSIIGFFVWQMIITALQTAIIFTVIWRILGGIGRARFDARILRSEWKFAASISANSLVGALITQADKVILSGVAPLKELGYYSVAGTVAAALWFVILPVNTAVYPRFAQLLAAKDEAALSDLFHKACQTVALLVLPAGVTLALFGHAVIILWTGSAATADQAGLIVPLLVTGTTLYGLSSVPAYLQFAAGWPQLTLYTNIASALVLIPATVYAVRLFSAPGAAVVWLLVNAAYFVPAAVMFKRIIPTQRRRWYVRDLGIPVFAASLVGGLMRWIQPERMDLWSTVAYLAATGGLIFVAVFTVAPDIRTIVSGRVRAMFRQHAVQLTAL